MLPERVKHACREVYELTAVIALVRDEDKKPVASRGVKEAADEGHLLAHIKVHSKLWTCLPCTSAPCHAFRLHCLWTCFPFKSPPFGPQ